MSFNTILTIILCFATSFISLFSVISLIKENIESKKTSKKNTPIINKRVENLSYCENSRIFTTVYKNLVQIQEYIYEMFKPKDFFKIVNAGDDPCELNEAIEFDKIYISDNNNMFFDIKGDF